MSKKQKKLLPFFFLLVLIAVLSLILFVLTRSEGQSTEESTAEIPLSGMSVENLVGISWTKEGETLAFSKQEGVWVYDADTALPIDQQKLETLLTKLAALSAIRRLSDTALTAEELGLDTPSRQLTLTDTSGSWQLEIGIKNAVSGGYYAQDANGLYMVSAEDLSDLFPTLSSLYAAQTVVSLTADELQIMTVQHGDEVLVFEKSGDTWFLQGENAALDQDAVEKMANTFCEMQSSWSITHPEQAAQYGLETPELTVQAQTQDGQSAELRFGAQTAGDDTRCYLQSSESDTVYEVNSSYRNAFLAETDTLFAQEATAEDADETGSIVAEYPIGSSEDYADADNAK